MTGHRKFHLVLSHAQEGVSVRTKGTENREREDLEREREGERERKKRSTKGSGSSSPEAVMTRDGSIDLEGVFPRSRK